MQIPMLYTIFKPFLMDYNTSCSIQFRSHCFSTLHQPLSAFVVSSASASYVMQDFLTFCGVSEDTRCCSVCFTGHHTASVIGRECLSWISKLFFIFHLYAVMVFEELYRKHWLVFNAAFAYIGHSENMVTSPLNVP